MFLGLHHKTGIMANEKTPLLNSGETGGAAPKVGFAPSQEYVQFIVFSKVRYIVC